MTSSPATFCQSTLMLSAGHSRSPRAQLTWPQVQSGAPELWGTPDGRWKLSARGFAGPAESANEGGDGVGSRAVVVELRAWERFSARVAPTLVSQPRRGRTRRVVWMWFGAFPGAFGLGRAQPQRRGTSP